MKLACTLLEQHLIGTAMKFVLKVLLLVFMCAHHIGDTTYRCPKQTQLFSPLAHTYSLFTLELTQLPTYCVILFLFANMKDYETKSKITRYTINNKLTIKNINETRALCVPISSYLHRDQFNSQITNYQSLLCILMSNEQQHRISNNHKFTYS